MDLLVLIQDFSWLLEITIFVTARRMRQLSVIHPLHFFNPH